MITLAYDHARRMIARTPVSKRFYRNYMEPVVEKAVDQFLSNDPSVCGCESCWSDMVAAALNHLKPCYVTRTAGRHHWDKRKDHFSFAVEVINAVKASSELVQRNPRHNQSDRLQELAASSPSSNGGTDKKGKEPLPPTTKRYGR